MTIIDLDKITKEETIKFLFNGKEHEIRPITYKQTIELSKIETNIEEEEDTEKILNLQITYISLVIPSMDRDTLMTANMRQVQRIQEMIREVMSGQKSDDEVLYYRKKYADEYQKNLEGVEENKTEQISPWLWMKWIIFMAVVKMPFLLCL